MKNLEINFDTFFFRGGDIIRVILKKIFTYLRLREKQSCKYCGRNQKIIWIIKDEIWKTLPKKYLNKCLCLECFFELVRIDSCYRYKIIKDVKFFGIDK